MPTIRALYKSQCAAMLDALVAHMPEGVQWMRPAGGMFLWLSLPPGLDAGQLLPHAVAQGVAFVPGAAFYQEGGHDNTLRLSFTTASVAQIRQGIDVLAAVLREHWPSQPAAERR